ncbi:hypothetical protein HMI54_012676 [Coelomomyces lativittatus]|nr:hypothetical protein HMI54_012676 [Coelomomyces lativittatus]KAJ1502455.1 hypothetical protein HMI56_002690 [Coelomomyces lativittatus]KAJ1513113.1 hypothetical protein HMI55_005892 [Coelomomyces lativittatus]
MHAGTPKSNDFPQPFDTHDTSQPLYNEKVFIKESGLYKDPDLLLPIANVGRLMKLVLPNHAKISKESKEYMQECSTEFIAFITAEAVEKCANEKRKTLSGEDILYALTKLDFEKYSELLGIYLRKLREAAKKDNTVYIDYSDMNSNTMQPVPPIDHMNYPYN